MIEDIKERIEMGRKALCHLEGYRDSLERDLAARGLVAELVEGAYSGSFSAIETRAAHIVAVEATLNALPEAIRVVTDAIAEARNEIAIIGSQGSDASHKSALAEYREARKSFEQNYPAIAKAPDRDLLPRKARELFLLARRVQMVADLRDLFEDIVIAGKYRSDELGVY